MNNSTKRNGFTLEGARYIRDKVREISLAERGVLFDANVRANGAGEFFVRFNTWAKALGVGQSTLRRHVDSLCQMELLEKRRRFGRCNVYRLLPNRPELSASLPLETERINRPKLSALKTPYQDSLKEKRIEEAKSRISQTQKAGHKKKQIEENSPYGKKKSAANFNSEKAKKALKIWGDTLRRNGYQSSGNIPNHELQALMKFSEASNFADFIDFCLVQIKNSSKFPPKAPVPSSILEHVEYFVDGYKNQKTAEPNFGLLDIIANENVA